MAATSENCILDMAWKIVKKRVVSVGKMNDERVWLDILYESKVDRQS